MNLVKWLIEEKKCSIIDRNSHKPLTTANGTVSSIPLSNSFNY